MSAIGISHYHNLRKKSFLVELLPWIGGGTSTAIYPHVYLSRSVYDSVHSAHPDPYKLSTVIHEEEHIARIKKMGVKTWYWQYFVSSSFRLEEELAASLPQLAYVKSQGLTFNLERKARALSGHLYFWPISYERALQRLNKMWEDA